eukprot:TRINITY_DN3830_c0_g1_i4.p1 TRINITY_DN3830_c0_g1~~TRINITY_DN3830_c0_g1_i4.p1  ORF type:complete len:652 (+),score=55.32 TRINITY_DN3830_c0_g1_i4:113-1957(+)
MDQPQKHRFRLVEFFIVLGVSDVTELQDGATLKGDALDTVPPPTPPDETLLRDIALFCFPHGVNVHDKILPPRYHTFALTDAVGAHLYGCCLTFDESFRLLVQAQGKEKEMQGPVEGYVEKCLCIVSRMACIRTFKRYLTTLYSTFRGNGFTPELPIESYLAHLVQVPIPPPGRIALSLVLPGQSQLQVFAPTILDFPLLDFPLHILFQSLDLENVLKLLMCVMLEKKILLVSKRLSLLSLAAEGICCILWPFMWRMTYVPLLNRDLFIYTEAPAPFIMGAHSSMVSGKLDWVTIVDLDRNAVQIADPIPDFPAGPKKRLIDTLIDHIHPTLSELDNAFPREDEDRENHEQHIRAQFLIFYGELFGWFNHTAADQPTEEQAFIASRLPDESDFYNQMFATETWTSFSEDRRRDREDLFHQFLHQFYPISRSRTRPLHISLPAEIASSATTSNGPVTHSHGRARSVNETNRSRPDNSVLTGSGRNRKDENGSVPIARSRTPDNAAERINPPSESEREAAEEKCFIEQLEFLLKHFSKPDSVFATSAPKPVTISEVKPSKEGSPAVSRSEQPDRDQSSRERAAFLAAPVIAVKRPGGVADCTRGSNKHSTQEILSC